MYITVTDIEFTPVDRSGTTPYFNGRLGDRYKAVMSFYFQKGTIAGGSIVFDSAKTLTTATEDFVKDGFQVGETFNCPGSASNTGTFTITGVTSTVITVAESVTNETVNTFIWVTTKIIALDYLYNLVSNNQNANFQSNIDSCQQKYIVSGIDASVVTDVFFNIGTASLGWVTDTLAGIVCADSKINGVAITSDYKQQFTITHYFFVPAQQNQFRNLQTGQVPAQFPLTYCYGINGYYATPPIINASLTGVVPYGVGCFADQNESGTVPDFTIDTISYTDHATGATLKAVDFSKTTDVVIKIKSASGLFAGGVTLIPFHYYFPSTIGEYQNTPTTQRQNFMNDRCVTTIGGASANGEFYGTDYQVLKNVVCTLVDANTCTITLQTVYAAALQAHLKSVNIRNYAILISAGT